MLFREDKVARDDAEAIRKGVGFYRWTHDLVEITGKDALEVLQKIYISDISKGRRRTLETHCFAGRNR